MTTCDAVGPQACVIAGTIGYLVFATAIVLLMMAFMRATLDLTSAIAKFRAVRRSSSPPLARPRPRGLYDDVDRLSPVPAIPPDVAPVPAMPARVLAFQPRKTRNRVVVR